MTKQPAISVLLYFRNQAAEAESLLEEVLKQTEPEIEWIIIDDASEDQTAAVVDSMLQAYDNDRVYFFQNEARKGRAQSFNDAIQHINSSCIWTSHQLIGPKQKTLLKSVQSFLKSGKPIAIHSGVDIPTTAQDWLQSIKEGVHIPDDCFLLRVEGDLQNRYFNPFLEQCLLFELALRTREQLEVFVPTGSLSGHGCELNLLRTGEQEELCFSLIRSSLGHERIRQQAMEIISPYQQSERNLSELELEQLLDSAHTLIKENDLPAALESCDRILQHHPFHEATLILKVRILEKLKQFVAASELKHRLKMLQKERHDSEQELPVVRDQAIANEGLDVEQESADDHLESKQEPREDLESTLKAVNLKQQQELQKGAEEDSKEREEQIKYDIHTSIIIPTTAGGRPALEHCLTRLHQYANPVHYELIVVNNASQDDTDELIEQLEEEKFLQCRALNNHSNKGVSASYAQALPLANGKYALLMHNDCLLEEGSLEAMYEVMEQNEQILLCGPLTNTAPNREQLIPEDGIEKGDLIAKESPYLDGCCLYLRLNAGIKPDDSFYPAYFEDMDLCWQVKKKGGKCAVATKAVALHHKGYTTSQMGWDENSATYWKNASEFAQKWGLSPATIQIPSEDTALVVSFAAIGELINFWRPESHLIEQARTLLTPELRTQVRQVDAPDEKLRAMLSLAILLDDRELVRTIEDKIEPEHFDEQSIRKLCHYYFQKNIYSRLRTYLGDYHMEALPLDLQMLYLEMLIKDKEFEDASPQLERLYNEYPSHPKLNMLAADLYKVSGDLERAAQFKKKAEALDPSLLNRS